MAEIQETMNKVMYLLCNSDKAMRKAIQHKKFSKYFQEDDVAEFIVEEFFEWFRQYDSKPSMRMIYDKNESSKWGANIRIRFKVLSSIGKSPDAPAEGEFDALVDILKIQDAKSKFSDGLQKYADLGGFDSSDTKALSDDILDFGKRFVDISNDLNSGEEGEYSYTTHEVEDNIGKILNRDLSHEKRFRIGHALIDDTTNGFKYGDLLMILGNINQGKSMVLANMCYNLWREGHNVILFTAEMRPEQFDERIYSRASAVDYNHILAGKQFLNEGDKLAFDECVKSIKSKDNHIITKFLRSTDNVATVEGYLEDLRLSKGFIPDVVVVDSLEHISALYPPVEMKDWQIKGQIITEFKSWSETYLNMRGVFVISTHQAKTETNDKKFDDITITDFGRSKIVPEKADFAIYLRTISEMNIMNLKLIKARRCQNGLNWSMATDFSRCSIMESDDDTNSESFIGDDD